VSESDPLDRPATAEEIEMVERLLKRRPAEKVVTLPKARPVRKSSTEVLALPVMPLLSTMRRRGPSHFNFSDFSGPGAVVLQFVDPTKSLRASDRRSTGWVREGDRPEKPARSGRGDRGWVWGLVEDE
jgi:hypothetical protein